MQIKDFHRNHVSATHTQLRATCLNMNQLMHYVHPWLKRSCYHCVPLNLILKNSVMNNKNQLFQQSGLSLEELAGKRILFANFPADGHFNPLTNLAVHLQWLGCDVRWYTSNIYAEKIRSMGIRHYPFDIAKDVNGENLETVFPEREKIKGAVKKLNFDMINAFILRGEEYYADIVNIYREFRFDMMIADCTFTGIPFVTDKMDIPVLSIGVVPLVETSKDLPPPGLGMTPSYSLFG